MLDPKPFSEACERNREPILAVLQRYFADRRRVLEIGSGTGQHAVYFAAALAHLTWQTSERAANLAGIRQWLEEAGLANLPPPLELDVTGRWPAARFDALFTANTLHIMSWPEVEKFFAGVGAVLEAGGVLAVYGPFNYNGEYTSESNARFDEWLRKNKSPQSGIRHMEDVRDSFSAHGVSLLRDYSMPENNHCLVFEKV